MVWTRCRKSCVEKCMALYCHFHGLHLVQRCGCNRASRLNECTQHYQQITSFLHVHTDILAATRANLMLLPAEGATLRFSAN